MKLPGWWQEPADAVPYGCCTMLVSGRMAHVSPAPRPD